ncbi:MAG: hypothetical protein ACLQNE_45160 [Thermoguttaceae bacterium]
MHAICIFTSGLMFALTAADNLGAESRPAVPPATVQQAIHPIPGENTDQPQPTLAPRSAAELVEEIHQLKADAARSREQIRQLKQRIAVLERRPPPTQGPKGVETRILGPGKLVLDNRTRNTHSVSVNGSLYSVTPGRTTIEIPVGPATVYMPFHEAPKQWGLDRWQWNGQNYELLIVVGYP